MILHLIIINIHVSINRTCSDIVVYYITLSLKFLLHFVFSIHWLWSENHDFLPPAPLLWKTGISGMTGFEHFCLFQDSRISWKSGTPQMTLCTIFSWHFPPFFTFFALSLSRVRLFVAHSTLFSTFFLLSYSFLYIFSLNYTLSVSGASLTLPESYVLR